MTCYTDQAAFHANELSGSEGVTCDCCGQDCTGIENHDLITFRTKEGDVDEVFCNGCIENELA